MWGARRWDQLTPGYTADPGFALTDTTSWWGWQRAVEGSTRRCRGMNVVDGDFQTHPQVAVLKSAAERQLQSVVARARDTHHKVQNGCFGRSFEPGYAAEQTMTGLNRPKRASLRQYS